jgi:hypothetical protein
LFWFYEFFVSSTTAVPALVVEGSGVKEEEPDQPITGVRKFSLF